MNPAPVFQLNADVIPAMETEVLQLMAHELRQPLSAIESIAYYLSMVLPQHQERAREQVRRIQQLVEQTGWIVTCGLRLTSDAAPAPEPLDLAAIITEAVAARGSLAGPPVALDLSGDLPLVQFDPECAKALMENLLTLFAQISSAEHPLRIRTWKDGSVILEMTTSMPGHRSEHTFGPGGVLGIACARRIVEAHSGGFMMQADPAGGIRVQVVLP